MDQVSLVQHHKGILEMVVSSSPVVMGVLIILILLSVWSWAITIAKILQFRRARRDSTEFRTIFWESRNFSRIDDSSRRLAGSPLTHLFSSGYRELSRLVQRDEDASARLGDLSGVEHALKQAEFEQSLHLERGVTFLATVASAAPFIGLFGTVWGIMNAFQGLSTTSNTTLQAVAPGISEALVATAIGLAAAIPAAMAYNYFAVAIRQFRQSMESFAEEFLTIARRSLVK